MAATITFDAGQEGRYVQGDRYVRTGTLNVGTYATNGVAVTKANFDLPVSLTHLEVDSSGGYIFEFDKANSKIKAYRQKDPAAAGGADIPLPEVANAVDLSSITPRFRAVGK
jgi:hypothetical protein